MKIEQGGEKVAFQILPLQTGQELLLPKFSNLQTSGLIITCNWWLNDRRRRQRPARRLSQNLCRSRKSCAAFRGPCPGLGRRSRNCYPALWPGCNRFRRLYNLSVCTWRRRGYSGQKRSRALVSELRKSLQWRRRNRLLRVWRCRGCCRPGNNRASGQWLCCSAQWGFCLAFAAFGAAQVIVRKGQIGV